MIWKTTITYVFWKYYSNTYTSTRNFTGTEQLFGKSREHLFENLWIYYILSNDKENIPNKFAVVTDMAVVGDKKEGMRINK